MTKIVSIHSYRGGTGKSNMTANLATTMALQGKRVALVDTDIQSPGVNVLFGLGDEQIEQTLNDYLWGRCPLKDAAYDVSAALNAAAGSLYLIPSSMKCDDIARVLSEGYDVELLQEGFYDLNEQLCLDYLFIDTHPGINEETLLSIGISDVLVLILRPDQQDYLGTAVVVEVADSLEVPQMLLVVNKVLPEFDTEALRQKVAEIYGQPVAGILPLSTDMLRLGSQGLFCLEHPASALTAEFGKIASYL
jgi:MinD-like ATPase involved in chromosome partitioning or flagellar assembly